jgi:hypothetical protein
VWTRASLQVKCFNYVLTLTSTRIPTGSPPNHQYEKKIKPENGGLNPQTFVLLAKPETDSIKVVQKFFTDIFTTYAGNALLWQVFP